MGMCGAHGADGAWHLHVSNFVTPTRFESQGRGWANRDPYNARKPADEIVTAEFCMFGMRRWRAAAAEDRKLF